MNTTTQTDIKDIAKEIRAVIKTIPGAVFSVTINRQWSKLKRDPESIIYISGMIKHWGHPDATSMERVGRKILTGYIKDIAEEHQLEVIEGMAGSRFTLVQKH